MSLTSLKTRKASVQECNGVESVNNLTEREGEKREREKKGERRGDLGTEEGGNGRRMVKEREFKREREREGDRVPTRMRWKE